MENVCIIYYKVYESGIRKHLKSASQLTHAGFIKQVDLALICGRDRNACVVWGGGQLAAGVLV